MPPDQLSTLLWKRALGFLRIVWMNFRVDELFWGIFAGFLAAAAAPAARAIFGSAVDGHHPSELLHPWSRR